MEKLPREIASKVDCHPTYIDKINRGIARPSPALCERIITEMKARGIRISFFELRPDLKDLMVGSL